MRESLSSVSALPRHSLDGRHRLRGDVGALRRIAQCQCVHDGASCPYDRRSPCQAAALVPRGAGSARPAHLNANANKLPYLQRQLIKHRGRYRTPSCRSTLHSFEKNALVSLSAAICASLAGRLRSCHAAESGHLSPQTLVILVLLRRCRHSAISQGWGASVTQLRGNLYSEIDFLLLFLTYLKTSESEDFSARPAQFTHRRIGILHKGLRQSSGAERNLRTRPSTIFSASFRRLT